jgi:hypothetical protein
MGAARPRARLAVLACLLPTSSQPRCCCCCLEARYSYLPMTHMHSEATAAAELAEVLGSEAGAALLGVRGGDGGDDAMMGHQVRRRRRWLRVPLSRTIDRCIPPGPVLLLELDLAGWPEHAPCPRLLLRRAEGGGSGWRDVPLHCPAWHPHCSERGEIFLPLLDDWGQTAAASACRRRPTLSDVLAGCRWVMGGEHQQAELVRTSCSAAAAAATPPSPPEAVPVAVARPLGADGSGCYSPNACGERGLGGGARRRLLMQCPSVLPDHRVVYTRDPAGQAYRVCVSREGWGQGGEASSRSVAVEVPVLGVPVALRFGTAERCR